MDFGANKTNALGFGPVIIFFKILAVGSHIHEKNRCLKIRTQMFPGNYRLFYGVHTANRRTVFVIAFVQIPRTDTLKPGDFSGLLPVGGALHVTCRRTTGGKYPFELHTGDDIGQFGVLIIVKYRRIKGFKPGRHDDGSDVECKLRFCVIEINGLRGANLFAGAAFTLLQEYASVRIDHVFERYGLGIRYVDGLAFGDPLVEFIGGLCRTFFRTGSAGDTFVHIHITG